NLRSIVVPIHPTRFTTDLAANEIASGTRRASDKLPTISLILCSDARQGPLQVAPKTWYFRCESPSLKLSHPLIAGLVASSLPLSFCRYLFFCSNPLRPISEAIDRAPFRQYPPRDGPHPRRLRPPGTLPGAAQEVSAILDSSSDRISGNRILPSHRTAPFC